MVLILMIGWSGINVRCEARNDSNCHAYYKYEKITDENIIANYKEIKNNSENIDISIMDIEGILSKETNDLGWESWFYFNSARMYPVRVVNVGEEGLYYLWVYYAGDDVKDIYGYILIDNLQPEIALESITLQGTAKIELGKTLTLTPRFNPENATNKIVTWESSDETIATVDNGGKITPKKVGSTIITVTAQDGDKKANCTVTIVDKTQTPKTGDVESPKDTDKPKPIDSPKPKETVTPKTEDKTIATGRIPQTGLSFTILTTAIILLGMGIHSIIKNNKYSKI